MTCYRGTPVYGEAPEIGLSFASTAEFVHLRRCRTSHKALSPRNKWLVGRLSRLRRFSLATLLNMCCGCVASAWLMGLTAEAKQAGLRYLAVPPAPRGPGPVVWGQWIFIGSYDYATSSTTSPAACCRLVPHARRWQLVLRLLIFSKGIIRHRFPVRTQMPCAY